MRRILDIVGAMTHPRKRVSPTIQFSLSTLHNTNVRLTSERSELKGTRERGLEAAGTVTAPTSDISESAANSADSTPACQASNQSILAA